jgi:nucleotide-binding universal stress UspA family protein
MLPIKTILHPTDFSERSNAAFDLACSLARDYQAKIHILHVAPEPVVGYGQGIVPPETYRYQHVMHEKLDQLVPKDAQVQIQRRLALGDAATEILRLAGEIKTDMIVMGTHGWTGLARLLMGSVAEQVVRRASCPVLTVKTPLPEPVSAPQARALEAVTL